jgi:hypothetical protein
MKLLQLLFAGFIIVTSAGPLALHCRAENPATAEASQQQKDLLIKTFEEMHRAHIVANTPPGKLFDRYLTRDLDACFTERMGRKVRTTYELLQKDAIHIGVGFPYYYIWVKIFDDKSGELLDEGLTSAKAMDQKEFGIGSKLNHAEEILKNPGFPDFFPDSLCLAILGRAAVVQAANNVSKALHMKN